MNIKRILHTIFIMALSVTLLACGGGQDGSDTPFVESIEINLDQENLTTQSNSKISVLAHYSDNSVKDITSEISWELSDESLATIDSSGMLNINNHIASLELTATYQSLSAHKTIQINQASDAILKEITLNDVSLLTNLSPDQQIPMTVVYSDGSVEEDVLVIVKSIDSSNTSNAKVQLTIETEDVEITIPDNYSANNAFTVTAVSTPETNTNETISLSSLAIIATQTTLLSGDTTNIVLEATYSDGSVSTISNPALTSTGPVSLNDSNTVVTANTVDETTVASIHAELDNMTASVELTINPAIIEDDVAPEPTLTSIMITINNTELSFNESTAISAKGTYSDSTTQDISDKVSWEANNQAITIDGTTKKLSTHETSGAFTITAKLDGKTTSRSLTISAPPPVLQSITLGQSNSVLTKDDTFQLSITAQYDTKNDETPSTGVNWESSNNTIATVDSNGLITALGEGSATITASYETLTASVQITVEPAATPSLIEIKIVSEKNDLLTFEQISLSAIGIYSNGSSPNTEQDISNSVVWTSSKPGILTVESNESAHYLKAQSQSGMSTISAQLNGISVSADFSVTIPETATSVGLEIKNVPTDLTVNVPTQLPRVSHNFSDGGSTDVSNEVIWSSDNTEIVYFENNLLTTGILVGTANITAYLPTFDLSVSTAINVTSNAEATVTSIYITNPPSTLFFNSEEPLTARAVYSDNSEQELNQGVIWSSSNTSIADINSAGLISSKNQQGYVSFNATYQDTMTDSIDINVTPENTYDNLKLQLDSLPQNTLIDDGFNSSPKFSVFNNPVGITSDLYYILSTPGIFITYSNPLNSERLVFVLPSNATSGNTYDKTNSHAYYIPADNNQLTYELNNASESNFNLEITDLGDIGNYATGNFSTTLCARSSLAPDSCSGKIQLSGSFYIKIETASTFVSTNNSSNPELIYPDNFSQVRQIATQPNYYYEITNKGVTYDFVTDNVDVQIEVVDGNDMSTVIATSTLNSDNSGHIVTIDANTNRTYLKLTYTGDGEGATFTLHNNQGDLVAQGSAEVPYLIGNNDMPVLAYGTVDTTISYYEMNVLANHNYIAHVTNVITADKSPQSNITMEYSLSNAAGSYIPCAGIASCDINSTTGKIYLKVNGHDVNPTSFDIEVEYAPEHYVDLTLPVVDRIGQVSYKKTSINEMSNNILRSGRTIFWIPNSELTPDTYYLISLKGIKAFTTLWVNNLSFSLTDGCSAGGTIISDEPYCIVKTRSFLNTNSNAGFSIEVNGEFSGSGTPFILNVDSIDPSNVYYLSTYANGKTGCIEGLYCSPLIGMRLYHPGESQPFAFNTFNFNKPYINKMIMINPGETILVQLFDPTYRGNYYSMQIRQDKFASSNSYFTVDDPDKYEFNGGDNSAETATGILLNEETQHSFSHNNGQFSDEDWFTFTAPVQ